MSKKKKKRNWLNGQTKSESECAQKKNKIKITRKGNTKKEKY